MVFDNPRAVRAMCSVYDTNPISPVVRCHRINRSDELANI